MLVHVKSLEMEYDEPGMRPVISRLMTKPAGDGSVGIIGQTALVDMTVD